MKLNEVAAPQLQKCGLIANLHGDHSMDRDSFEGIGVFTSRTAFIAELKTLYLDIFGPDDEGNGMDEQDVADLKKAKTMEDMTNLQSWQEFLEQVWVDDRF